VCLGIYKLANGGSTEMLRGVILRKTNIPQVYCLALATCKFARHFLIAKCNQSCCVFLKNKFEKDKLMRYEKVRGLETMETLMKMEPLLQEQTSIKYD
jgi:hypothetical protein